MVDTVRVELKGGLQGRLGYLGHFLKKELRLKHVPNLSIEDDTVVIETTVSKDKVEEVVKRFDKTPNAGQDLDRVRTIVLLDKDTLTPEEDDELKRLHRRWLRQQLGG